MTKPRTVTAIADEERTAYCAELRPSRTDPRLPPSSTSPDFGANELTAYVPAEKQRVVPGGAASSAPCTSLPAASRSPTQTLGPAVDGAGSGAVITRRPGVALVIGFGVGRGAMASGGRK